MSERKRNFVGAQQKHCYGVTHIFKQELIRRFQRRQAVVGVIGLGTLKFSARRRSPNSSAVDVKPVQFEHSVGMAIFERSSGGMRATQAGRDFLRTALSILEQLDTLVTSAHSAGRGESGRLAIGFYTSLSAGNLRATLVDYARRFPQIDVRLAESSRTRLVTALRNGSIDIAIITGEMPLLDGKGMPLWSERIVVALPEGHRLAVSKTIYWTDLRDERGLLS